MLNLVKLYSKEAETSTPPGSKQGMWQEMPPQPFQRRNRQTLPQQPKTTAFVSSMVSISRVSRLPKPTFSLEISYWNQGYSSVIGVDEVGRGALAGPVVAGAVMLKRIKNYESRIKEIIRLGINDSKQLSAKQREILVPEIQTYFHCTIGEASVGEINRYGIVKATRKAMRRAIRKLLRHPERPEGVEGSRPHTGNPTGFFAPGCTRRCVPPLRMTYLLIDGFPLPRCSGFPIGRQRAIIGGDRKSISIAAASIIAKVHRDSVMTGLSDMYVSYRWEKNKGYGTQPHRDAIQQHGTTPLHRLDFL